MTAIYSSLVLEDIDNRRFSKTAFPFEFESDVLKKLGLKYRCRIETGFVQDKESVPIVRGTNNRGGIIHDYFSRINSDPVVTKAQAAAIYYEFMRHCYRLDTHRGRIQTAKEYVQAWVKWGVVYVWPRYFHIHYVEDSAEDIAGCKEDPFVTAEKIEALIVKQEAVTSGLQAVPESVDAKADLIDASKQVVEDLKDAKEDIRKE